MILFELFYCNTQRYGNPFESGVSHFFYFLIVFGNLKNNNIILCTYK